MTESYKNEFCHQEVTNSDDKPHQLQINLQNYVSLASAILNEKTQYKTVEIRGVLHRDAVTSDLFQRFWCEMGSMVTELVVISTLIVDYDTPKSYLEAFFNHFICLKTLKVKSCFLHLLPPDFYKRNENLEKIEIFNGDGDHDQVRCILEGDDEKTDREKLTEISKVNLMCGAEFENRDENGLVLRKSRGVESVEYKDWEVLDELKNIFIYTTSLKRISFPCKLKFDYERLNTGISNFLYKCSSVDEVSIDYNSSFSYSNCFVSKIDLEIVNSSETRKKAIMKLIEIEISLKEILGSRSFNHEADFCFFRHYSPINITIEKVTIHWTYNGTLCHICLKSIIKCFPKAKCVIPSTIFKENFDDPQVSLKKITQISTYLPHQTHVELFCKNNLELWPVFKQLLSLKISLQGSVSMTGLVNLCQCCPNLEEFSISFSVSIGSSTYIAISERSLVHIITEHLVKVKKLKIQSELKIGIRSLHMICLILKQLTKLSIGFDENPKDLFKLFKYLPQLELIEYQSIEQWKRITRQEYQCYQDSVVSNITTETNYRDALEILPEEIWALILKCLPKSEQLNCRRVCKRWWDVLNTYTYFDRELRLKPCELAFDTNPVKTFVNTRFNYNRFVITENIYVTTGYLNDFWRQIGRTINEIFFDLYFHGAYHEISKSSMTIDTLPRLQSIEFRHCEFFFFLIQDRRDFILPMLRVIKKLKVNQMDQGYFRSYSAQTCPNMPNLEFLKFCFYTWDEFFIFCQWINGHCFNLQTLVIELGNFKDFIHTEISVLSQIKILKLKGWELNFENIEHFLTDIKALEMLTLHEKSVHIEEVNICKIAIRFFKRNSNLNCLMFSHLKRKIKYKLEYKNCVKNIVQYDYSNSNFSKEVVFTQEN